MTNYDEETDYVRRISHYLDAVYSPDDSGWYLQHHGWNQTSQVFPSREAALRALDDGTVQWS